MGCCCSRANKMAAMESDHSGETHQVATLPLELMYMHNKAAAEMSLLNNAHVAVVPPRHLSAPTSTHTLSHAQSNELPLLQGRDASNASTVQQQHKFLDAAKSGDNNRVQMLVLASPDLINCQPAHRWSALHFAAFQGNGSLVEILLAHGASVETKGRDGETPLDVAQPEVFERLLAAISEESTPGQDVRASQEIISTLALRPFMEGCDKCEECHICLEDFVKEDQVRDLPCGHYFHACCIDNWLVEKSGSCPICRASVIN